MSNSLTKVNLSTGTIQFLVADALGSVRGVVSSGGALTASTSFDAWGNPETSGGLSSYSPIGFAGGYTDPTGLTYFINRYYDATTGQFVNVDPIVNQSDQPYIYVNDNPLNATDPLGTVAVALMGGGSQTLRQQAAVLNKVFQQQLNSGKAIGGGIDSVVVTSGGHQSLVALFSPSKNACVPNKKIHGIVLETGLTNGTGHSKSGGLSTAGAIITAGGAAAAGMGGPLLNVGEAIAIAGGGDMVTAAGLALVTGGAAVAVIGITVLVVSIFWKR